MVEFARMIFLGAENNRHFLVLKLGKPTISVQCLIRKLEVNNKKPVDFTNAFIMSQQLLH